MKFSIFIEKFFKHRRYLGVGAEIPLSLSLLRLSELSQEPSPEIVDRGEQVESDTTARATAALPRYVVLPIVKTSRTGGEPQAGTTVNALDGAGDHLSQATAKPF